MKPKVKLKPKQAKPAEVRLLPAVIAVGVILFGVKAAGIRWQRSPRTKVVAGHQEISKRLIGIAPVRREN